MPWVILVVVLVVVAWRVLPAPYAAFSTAVVLVALSRHQPRLLRALRARAPSPSSWWRPDGLASRRVEVVVLTLSGAAMFAYALAAFVNRLVP